VRAIKIYLNLGVKSKGKNLLDRLIKYKGETLAFMKDFTIPSDNNIAGRDVCITQVKQKISGCFRSQRETKFLCRVRGYISTIKKHGGNVIEELYAAFRGSHLIFILDTN
jgi:transposase